MGAVFKGKGKTPFNLWMGFAPLALIGLLLLAACAVNPVSGEQQLAFMSEAQELQMGGQLYPQAVQMFGGKPPYDEKLQIYVQRVGRRLARQSHRPNLPWDFAVVNEGMINAFALPGGKICITRGLISKMRNEDELAAVLGHEIGHVTARHAVSAHARSTLVGLGVAGVGAALSGVGLGQPGAQLAGLAGNVLLMSYSRDQERQADELGYQYMTRCGYNPRGMVELFGIFRQEEKNSPGAIAAFFSSHPLTDERISTARRRVGSSSRNLTGQPMKTGDFNRALQAQKRRAPAYAAFDKGKELAAKKKYSQAVQSFWKGIRLFGRDGLMHYELARAYYSMGMKTKARKMADKGAKLSPNVFMINVVAGALNLETKRPRQAIPHFKAANRVLPNHSGSRFLLGVAYEQSGRKRDAVHTYRQVVRLDPQGKAGQAAASRLTHMGYRP